MMITGYQNTNKIILNLWIVTWAVLAIGQVQAESIFVPNHSFELIYKPGSTTITADIGGGWTWGVGMAPGLSAPMNGTQTATFSDGTTGTSVYIPGWINAGAPWDVPPYVWTEGSGSIAGQHTPPDGQYYFTANGSDWGNAPGGAIESDAPLGIITGGTYTLSILVNGPVVPVVLDLLADGVPITPSSTVDPGAPYAYDTFTRTYDEASLTDHFGKSLTIRVGFGPGTTGTQGHIDLVTLAFENNMNPSPVNGATVPLGNVDLSWTNLDPNVGDTVWVDVWFGTEPNELNPGYDMTKIVIAGVNTTTVQVSAPTEGTYYWQVDSYIDGSPTGDPVVGPVWRFTALDDVPPSLVNAGDEMITWSGQPVPLDPCVVDDGKSDLSYTWRANPVDGVVFSDPCIAAPTVTITKATANPSTVTLTLSVHDESNPTPLADPMEIDVYDNACLAAIGAGLDPVGPADFDGNCNTDIRDYAALAAKWYLDYALTTPTAKP